MSEYSAEHQRPSLLSSISDQEGSFVRFGTNVLRDGSNMHTYSMVQSILMKNCKVFFLVSVMAAIPIAAYSSIIIVTPGNPQGWSLQNQSGTGSGAIDSSYPRSGSGSIDFGTSSTSDKADFEKDLSGAGFGTLNQVAASDLAFDYYRNSTSTTAAYLAPVMRLLFYNYSTGTGGNLIWESAYNTGNATVATDAWQHIDTTNGFFYLKPFGSPVVEEYNHTLNYWESDPRVGGTVTIYGVNTGVGSGWDGTFRGASDNVTIAGDTYNFEPFVPSATPEPATWALMGGAMFVLVFARKRLALIVG